MLTNTRPIGHDALMKRYESAKREISRLRDVIKRRNETIGKLRKKLEFSKKCDSSVATAIAEVMQRRRCGCRHCLEVAKGANSCDS